MGYSTRDTYRPVIPLAEAEQAERAQLVEAHHIASRDFDRAVITLAGGALALSVTFIHDIAARPAARWELLTAWLSLGLSLLLIVASFVTSQQGLLRRIGRIDRPKSRSEDESVSESSREGFFTATSLMSYASGFALVTGFAFLAAFSLANVK